jgi:hypothetical protein
MGSATSRLSLVVFVLSGTIAADEVLLPLFSRLPAGGPITGWQVLKPAPKAPDTRYTLVDDAGAVVVQAEAVASMSGLVRAVPRSTAGERPHLHWRWRIERPLTNADMTQKAGDDYAARVYVLFDYPRERLPWATRAKLALAEALYGQPVPTAALNYVWDNRQPVGTIKPNAYTERVRMVVLESGAAKAGQWVSESRDLNADFRAAFGEDAPPVSGVAIATDTDNTGETVRGWFGDLELR